MTPCEISEDNHYPTGGNGTCHLGKAEAFSAFSDGILKRICVVDMEGKSIVLIEDDHPTRELVATNLRAEGYEVMEATTGERGLELAMTENPDLLLLDLLLPRMDGWEVLAKLRGDPQTSDLPVIIITALGEVRHRAHGLRGGADDYISKPFSAPELLARVEAVLKRSTRGEREQFPEQIPGRKGNHTHLVKTADIDYIDTRENYTYIHSGPEEYITHYNLSELERALDPDDFYRAHRAYIVNVNRIEEISRGAGSSYEITLNDAARTRIPLSRRRAAGLRRLVSI